MVVLWNQLGDSALHLYVGSNVVVLRKSVYVLGNVGSRAIRAVSKAKKLPQSTRRNCFNCVKIVVPSQKYPHEAHVLCNNSGKFGRKLQHNGTIQIIKTRHRRSPENRAFCEWTVNMSTIYIWTKIFLDIPDPVLKNFNDSGAIWHNAFIAIDPTPGSIT